MGIESAIFLSCGKKCVSPGRAVENPGRGLRDGRMKCQDDHKREVIDTTRNSLPPHTGGMDVDLAFGGLVAARLLLSFTPLPDQLKYDHLLSSPLTSNLRCNPFRINVRI